VATGTGEAAFQALAVEARRRYLAALQAQRDNDWARYGEEMRRLGELLEQIGGGGAGRRPQRRPGPARQRTVSLAGSAFTVLP